MIIFKIVIVKLVLIISLCFKIANCEIVESLTGELSGNFEKAMILLGTLVLLREVYKLFR